MQPARFTFRQSFRSMPAAAWILFGGSFLNRFGTFVVPFLVLYLTSRGFSIARAGFATGCYGAGHLGASIVGGWLADRVGRRYTIVISMFSSAVAMMALSQARAYPTICILTFITGLCAEIYRPAASALIADLVLPEARVTGYALYRLAINLGFASGVATAGFLAKHGFFLLFAGDALSSVLYGVVALAFLPHGIGTTDNKGQSWMVAIRKAAENRRFVWFLVSSVCITFVIFQFTSSFALHVKDCGFPPSTYGSLIALNGVLIVAFELALTAWTSRRPARVMIALGFILVGTGFALTGLAHTVVSLALTICVWTFGEMISSPTSAAYVAEVAPVELRGRFMGMWSLTWSIGLTTGPSLGSLLYAKNPAALWVLCGILGIISTALLMISGSTKVDSLPVASGL
ncbi:MAG TPA: MFS transporter [Thermoanaerobaculia bacterium]|nr:MFS transporter [Thermoanaerobaculia bacterium]